MSRHSAVLHRDGCVSRDSPDYPGALNRSISYDSVSEDCVVSGNSGSDAGGAAARASCRGRRGPVTSRRPAAGWTIATPSSMTTTRKHSAKWYVLLTLTTTLWIHEVAVVVEAISDRSMFSSLDVFEMLWVKCVRLCNAETVCKMYAQNGRYSVLKHSSAYWSISPLFQAAFMTMQAKRQNSIDLKM